MNKNIQASVRVLIKDLLGMPSGSVRPQDNQPVEGNNFAIMRVAESNPIGWGGSNDGSVQSVIDTITIDFFGVRASHYASQLKIAMQSPYATEQMYKLGLGFIDCDAGRDLTALELDQIDRYQVKMRLSHSTKYERPDMIQGGGHIEQILIGPTDDYPNAKGLIAEP